MNEYPLHWYVYENDVSSLKQALTRSTKVEIDRKDLRNKTPLELAIFLDRFDCARLLVEHGADCTIITKTGWNLVQESVSTGNYDLIKLIMAHREFQRAQARKNGIPDLLNKLKQAPDFYVEMKWEFTSWIPLVSKVCPSDVYKVYKSGSNVRIDTTLIGFNGTSWERGNRSFIFQATPEGSARIIEIDHLLRTYHVDVLDVSDSTTYEDSSNNDDSIDLYEPDEYVIQNKLTSPNMVTFLDIEKIEFERNRSGLWGWRSDKNETINNYECKVYTANNLQLVTKTRVEHLNSERAKQFLDEMDEEDLKQSNSNGNIPGFLTNFFQGSEQHIKIEKSVKPLTSLEYFQKQINVDYYLNGSCRRIDETRKIQTFNAQLSLCDYYPLSLNEQVSPIVDLMALNNSHFKKLKEFITLQLPSGFPVKIEIPLYRVITAKVTFGNIHGLDNHVDHVTTIEKASNNLDLSNENDQDEEEDNANLIPKNLAISNKIKKPLSSHFCVVDDKIFKIPSTYRCTNLSPVFSNNDNSLFDNISMTNSGQRGASNEHVLMPRRGNYYGQGVDDDDILLQLAIQQSIRSTNHHPEEEEVTALEMLGHNNRDTSGATQSLEEFNQRLANRNNYVNTNDDDLILQRVLAESLITSNTVSFNLNQVVDSRSTNATQVEDGDEALRQIIEMSKREEEERLRRQQEEDEELKKILELSLVEK